MSLGVLPHATVQFEMSSTDPENYPIKLVKPQQECNMPDVITVRVPTGSRCLFLFHLLQLMSFFKSVSVPDA